MTEALADAVETYRRAIELGDESLVRAVFDRFRDDQLDELLDALDAAGLDVPHLSVEPESAGTMLEAVGIRPGIGAQLMTITSGSFGEFVRAQAAAFGLGADTIVGRVYEQAVHFDDADLVAAYTYVLAALEGDEPELVPTPSLVAALAHVLNAPVELVDVVAAHG